MGEAEVYKKEYEIDRDYGSKNWGKNVEEWVKANNFKSLLDVGCGDGRFAVNTSMFIENVYAIDIASVKSGMVINQPPYTRVKYYDASATAIPLEENKVEIVTAFDMLEHLPPEQVEFALGEMDRVSTRAMLFSISTKPCEYHGETLHKTVRNQKWWYDKLAVYGKVYAVGNVPETGQPYYLVMKEEKPRTVVYTTVVGGMDNLLQQFWRADHVRYVCFTDREIVNPPPEWKIVRVDRTCADPKKEIAKYKTMPHVFLEDWDVSIWIDATFQIQEKGLDEDIAYMGDADILMYKHPERLTTEDEARKVLELGYDDEKIVNNQMAHYKEQGFPDNFGKFPECNVIIRKNTINNVNFGTVWYSEIQKGSKRDQLSVMFSAWVTKPKLVIHEKMSRDHDRLSWMPHRPTKKKKKIVFICAVFYPEVEWINSLLKCIFALGKKYEIVVRPRTLTYLHSGYGELLGSFGMEGVDFKPFQGNLYDSDPLCRDYDYLFFFENDHVVEPEDIEALIERDVDVVSGLYVHWDGESMIHHDMPDSTGSYCHATKELPPPEKLYPVRHTGMGTLLVKRGIIEQIEHPWFQPMIVRYATPQTTIGWTGQDAGLCDKLLQAGIQPYVDPEVRVGHIKKRIVYPGDEAKKRNNVREEVAVWLEANAEKYTKKELGEKVRKLKEPQ
jgi:2-polyprenyl-3-methyl-5-hydroxy-6-metoxy-1,4-benzoquinol methylase